MRVWGSGGVRVWAGEWKCEGVGEWRREGVKLEGVKGWGSEQQLAHMVTGLLSMYMHMHIHVQVYTALFSDSVSEDYFLLTVNWQTLTCLDVVLSSFLTTSRQKSVSLSLSCTYT